MGVGVGERQGAKEPLEGGFWRVPRGSFGGSHSALCALPGRRSPIEGSPWPAPLRAPPESPRAPSPGSGAPGPPSPPQPPLPEKRHPPAPGGPRDPSSPQRSPGGGQGPPSAGAGPAGTPPGGTFVQDTTKFWYKPGLSREEGTGGGRGERGPGDPRELGGGRGERQKGRKLLGGLEGRGLGGSWGC